MPKVAETLNDKQVQKLRRGAPGMYAVGGQAGLHLRVVNPNSTQWVLRVVCGSCGGDKRHDIGLGNYPLVDLATARDEARGLRLKNRQGICIVDERSQARAARRAEKLAVVTFMQAANDLHTVKAKQFKNAKHAAQWITTLETYVFPKLGTRPVSSIQRSDVVAVLEPIWTTKTETATRVRQRIEQVIDYHSVVTGQGNLDNPARWRGGLSMLLPEPTKIKKVKHHDALPWKQAPAFMADLAKRDGTAAQALRFAILTAARSGEVRLATWREIDVDAKVWTVPAGRMKAGKAHRVPLSEPALALLAELPRDGDDALLFPGTEGKPLSDMSLLAVCQRMNVDATPHGFRSSFKDYARTLPQYLDEVSELALAHVSSDATRAAYARDELLEQRAALMRDWGKFLFRTE